MAEKFELQKLKEQFKARGAAFDNSARWVTDKVLLDMHQELAEASSDDLILEVCCGTGIVGQNLSQAGAKVVGLDLSPVMLKQASRRLFSCINGQAEHLPFVGNTFDIIVCRQAFHFLDTKQVLSEMSRITKPGGKVIISQTVPFGKEDREWLYKIHLRKQPLLKNFFTEEDLRSLLEEEGYTGIVLREYCIEEQINNWLVDTYFSKKEIDEIKKLFVNAPESYKALHRVRVIGEEIFDTMRWVVIRGQKT